ncbi:MAG: hypothetical protein NC924_00710 [Candidatus Omnitrophica bacterium]|nr:hypothetical protein [Candidatus Omnitrophota bacterium]
MRRKFIGCCAAACGAAAMFVAADAYAGSAGGAVTPPIAGRLSEDADAAEAAVARRVTVEGSYRLNVGYAGEDLIWKDANYLLQEKSWRYLFSEERENTFDPAIYNQVQVLADVPLSSIFFIYTKIIVDPWAFTGTSAAVSLPTWYGATQATLPQEDPVEVRLKYWSNNSRTYPEIIRSASGDAFALPEIKVSDGYAAAASVAGTFESGKPWVHRVDIPSLKIEEEFKPLRALQLDMETDEYSGSLFAYAEVADAIYSDDPLRLINRHIFWEPSPWFDRWQPGRDYFATGWEDGQWTRDFTLRRSTGEWLTLLRGARIEGRGSDFAAKAMFAAPIDPWENYSTVNNLPGAMRVTYAGFEQVTLGSIYSCRWGYDGGSVDAFDQAAGIDGSIRLWDDALTASAQAAAARLERNKSAPQFLRQEQDLGYAARLSGKSAMFDLPVEAALAYTWMGENFDPPLASYRYTRDDALWSRHIWFQPHTEDEERFRIGDGIDAGRATAGADLSLGPLEEVMLHLYFRNVNASETGKFVENIFRAETDYQLSEAWLWKALILYKDRPALPALVSPDTYTVAVGWHYAVTDWLSWQEIFERTTEYPVFPDGLYPWLDINPAPPYPPYNLLKSRLDWKPLDWMAYAAEYVHNEFKYAALYDDWLNYAGLESAFDLGNGWHWGIVYRYSRVADYLASGKVFGHHNVYSELRYAVSPDAMLRVEYGSLGNYVEGLGWQMTVLDTRHIIRLAYTGKF